MTTIKDISRETGLSLATISKYMNGGHVLDRNKDLIDEAIEKLGYKVNYFARGLKTNRSMTVGVLLPTISSPFFSRVVAAMDKRLRAEKYHCIVCSYDFDAALEQEKLRFLVSNNVDAIALVPEQITAAELAALVGDVPLVLIDRVIPDFRCDAVVADNLNAIYAAVESLFRRNHRRIGIIVGPQDVSTAYERMVG